MRQGFGNTVALVHGQGANTSGCPKPRKGNQQHTKAAVVWQDGGYKRYHPRSTVATSASFPPPGLSASSDADVRQAAGRKAGGPVNAQSRQRNKIINRQVTKAAEFGDIERLLQVVQDLMPGMNGINFATALHRVVKLSSLATSDAVTNGRDIAQIKQHPIFQELFSAIVDHVSQHSLVDECDLSVAPAPGEMPVQCLSIVAWSCAQLRLRHEALFHQIARIIAPRLETGSRVGELVPYELSNLLWAYVKLNFDPSELFQAVTLRLLRRQSGEFKAQCLSTIAWAFATVRRRNAAVFASLAKELTERADEVKPQEIANTLWAFAKSRCLNVELFRALGEAASRDSKVWCFKPQELSNTAWAFASAGMNDAVLFAQIEAVAVARVANMMPQNVANILWAFAKLRVKSEAQFFPTLLEAASKRLGNHKPQELSATIWAASEMCPTYITFFNAALRVCVQRLQEFSTNGLANLVKSFATIHVDEPSLYGLILKDSARRLPQFGTGGLCSLLLGTTRARQNPHFANACAEELEDLFPRLSESVAGRLEHLRPGELEALSEALQQRLQSTKLPEDECFGTLAEAVADRSVRLQGYEATACHGRAKAPVQSLGSMSTAAEESQAEEEELVWPTLDDLWDEPESESGLGPSERRNDSDTLHGSHRCSTDEKEQEAGYMPRMIHPSSLPTSTWGQRACTWQVEPATLWLSSEDAPWHLPSPACCNSDENGVPHPGQDLHDLHDLGGPRLSGFHPWAP